MQKDRLIYCVYGWGAGQECWLIEWAEIFGDPAKDAVWKQLDEQLLAKQYVHESKRLLPFERVCVDSGGKKGHPDRAYRYCAARLERGVFAVKGGQKKGIPLVGLPSTHNVYRTPLFVLCTDTGKHALMKRLLLPRGKSGEANPGYIHFYDMPDELRDESRVRWPASARSTARPGAPGKRSMRTMPGTARSTHSRGSTSGTASPMRSSPRSPRG